LLFLPFRFGFSEERCAFDARMHSAGLLAAAFDVWSLLYITGLVALPPVVAVQQAYNPHHDNRPHFAGDVAKQSSQRLGYLRGAWRCVEEETTRGYRDFCNTGPVQPIQFSQKG